MATANTRRNWLRLLVALVALTVLAGLLYRAPLTALARTGTAFGARTACACRYIAGRSLADCKKDFEPGMEAVFVSDDPDARSVTARVPLFASDRARFRPGYGCVLDPWDG